MTDRPYTDADLRAEAARQHKSLTKRFAFYALGEQMEGEKIASAGGLQWDQLGEEDFDTAQRAIDDLLNGAADVSAWAIKLGAAGLTPHEPHAIRSTTGGWLAAVQIATTGELTDAARAELLPAIRDAVEQAVCRVLQHKPAAPQG